MSGPALEKDIKRCSLDPCPGRYQLSSPANQLIENEDMICYTLWIDRNGGLEAI